MRTEKKRREEKERGEGGKDKGRRKERKGGKEGVLKGKAGYTQQLFLSSS